MLSDDFNTPLGLNKTRHRRRFVPSFTLPLGLPIIGLLVLCLAAAGAALLHRHRLGGEPVAVTAAKPDEQENPITQELRGVPHSPPTAAPAASAAATGSAPAKPAARGPTVTIIDGTTGKRREIVLPFGDGKAARSPP